MRQIVGVVIGLVFGIAGTFLFLQSLPPEEGSVEDRAEVAELELSRAQMRIKELEAITGDDLKRTTADAAREIAEDMKAGRLVDIDDIFKSAKPWMRKFAPVFDRIRVRDQKRMFDTLAGEFTRKYELDDRQQEALSAWLDEMAERNGRNYAAVLDDDSSGLEAMVRASRDFSQPKDLDAFMEGLLSGDTRETYIADRMEERVGNVQAEADRKVQRLDNIVALDESQKDEVFTLMARGSPDFDPTMRIEGMEGNTSRLQPGQSRDDAIMAVLRPEQLNTYEDHRQEQYREMEEEMRQIGLRPPANWDLWDEDDF